MCKNSTLIKHPHGEYHLRHAESIYLNGVKSYLNDVRTCYNDIPSFINQHFSVTSSNREEIYLTLCNNSYFIFKGRRFPVFLRLSCGKCTECRFLYKKEIENRALIEASESSHVFFYTLTYDDLHLPPCGLNKSDVSSSFKLLRTHIQRYLGFPVTFTHFYVGEYGTDPRCTLRPHYHGLIFVKESLSPKQINKFFDLFCVNTTYYDFNLRKVCYKLNDFYSSRPSLRPWWSKGSRIDIQSARNVSALVRYVCKYITKNFNADFNEILIRREKLEQHSNPLFIQLPKKRGLGCENVERYREKILSSTNGCISINVHGKVERIAIPNIFISKLFPTLSSVCPNAAFNYRLLLSVIDILTHRRSFLCNSQLKYILDFIKLRSYPLEYLSYLTLRKFQRTHLEIARAFYSEMSDYDLIETTQIILDDLDKAFDCDSFANRSIMLSDFQSHLYSSRPAFSSHDTLLKLRLDTEADINYIETHHNISLYDTFS